MTSLALLFTLASIGVSETVYLVKKRISAQSPICPIGGGCEVVLNSKYNKFFLIPNDVLGLLAYVVIAFIASFLVIGVGPTKLLDDILEISIALASLASIVFTYLQWRVLKNWCFWCLMSAFTIWFMEIIILFSKTV